jgi:L-serine/L-threonine ammonia-lyase
VHRSAAHHPESTRARIRETGAEVIVHGKVWDEANQRAMELAQGADTEYVPAFDHPVLWQGHSTMVDEILEDCPQVDALVTSVGGGGLLAGLLTGLIRHRRMDCRIVACETRGAASFAAAMAAGHPVRLPRIDTVATSLGASEVAAWPVRHILDFPHECVVLGDEEAIMGVVRYANDCRQLVEPACGVSLAIAYLDHPAIAQAHDVVIVVCGGVSITPALVAGGRGMLEATPVKQGRAGNAVQVSQAPPLRLAIVIDRLERLPGREWREPGLRRLRC